MSMRSRCITSRSQESRCWNGTYHHALCNVCVVFLSSKMAAALDDREMLCTIKLFHSQAVNTILNSISDDPLAGQRIFQQVQQDDNVVRIVLYAPILGIGGVINVFKTDSSMTWILGVAVGIILIVIVVLFQIAMPRFAAADLD